MSPPIRVAILEDHQISMDGYFMRLDEASGIQVTATARNGEELNRLLREESKLHVLIMDVHVPTSASDDSVIPILHYVPRILKMQPGIRILIISMLDSMTLVRELVRLGVSGYIFKDDSDAIIRLPAIIRDIVAGGRYFSQDPDGINARKVTSASLLTERQLEILSLCASYPDLSTEMVAAELGTASSTIRNSLSEIYRQLDVHSKAAAIAKAKEMGLIP